MKGALLGEKVGMTRIFDESGAARPVTVVRAGPCPVLAQRTRERHGYAAVQVGFGVVPADKKDRKVSKPQRGMFQVLGVDAYASLTEFCLAGDLPDVGAVLTVAQFAVGDKVDVRGKTKGRGFTGVFKRHNFHGGRETHGSKFHRSPGSSGTNTTPGRVKKGKKYPGQYGNQFRTVRNVKVVQVLAEDNLLYLEGGLPGANGSLLRIEKL